ncbi:hypothetical protein XPR_1227 [Xanthomonas arboricola pv. pruni MAFF 301420]|uniref:Uncharacterized protein n=1 Tax=Xanthomonas arboricola pv. pruni MAFF 301420 TaxID=1418095 RepID=W4SDW9_9XANT|nr:hypothetical protein XPR_1227 [Xanthomonas arboricola pv. pruni MAFF 301420]GAE59972.1 hypothetical protein XPN_1878 [Xanthomonas arboricola pv. pruni MAFF 301427]
MLGARCSTMVCRLNIQCRLGEAFSYAVTDYFSGAVSLPVAEPLAAWMDAAKRLQGWIHRVSRERQRRRALNQ